MKTIEYAHVLSNEEIRPGIWSMWLDAPVISRSAMPGQFVHVRVKESFDPLLRRPLSIGRVHRNRLELVWRIVGEGTRLLTSLGPESTLNLLGPLGTPFSIDRKIDQCFLAGGGLGLPPVVYLYEYLRDNNLRVELLIGAKEPDGIPLDDDDPVLREASVALESADGKAAYRGFVTDLLEKKLEEIEDRSILENTAIYACGPWGMISALQTVLLRFPLKIAEVSLEQQMGCGVGVCQGCAVEVAGGNTPYRLVCKDGPVFPIQMVGRYNG